MPNLTEDMIADLVASTHPDESSVIEQMAMEFTEYHVLPIWFQNFKDVVTSGRSIQKTVMYQAAEARFVSLNSLTEYNIVDHLKNMEIPWRRAQVEWQMHVEEALMNASPAQITDMLGARRDGARIGMADKLERAAWSAPTSSSDDLTPWGVKYWITQSATEGFNGGAATGFTTKGGIDPAINEKMKNWTFQYANPTKEDLIKRIRKAMFKTSFKNPINLQEFRGNKGRDFRIYAGYDTVASVESIGEGQNENLGRDVASMDGVTTIRGCGLYAVDVLEEDTNSPIYGINHRVFKPAVLKGAWMRESKPESVPYQPDWKQVRTNCTFNFVCLNPGRCFVGYV